jgi:organic hydroperoxide reductase OsmC/OhrA
MSNFYVEMNWNRENEFTYEKFKRDHVLHFNGGQTLNNSAAKDYYGNEQLANPEELLAGSLMSCHMMTFLAIASKSGYVVDSYSDRAEAIVEKNEEGRLAVTIINLKPTIVFSGDKKPDVDQLDSLHQKAHRNCFIANSIKTKVNIL